MDNAISNFIRFEDTPSYGSKLTITGVDNDGKHVASITPIQVQGNNIYGLQKLICLPDEIFRIENYEDNNASIELSDRLILKGLVDPSLPSDAATKQFVENLVTNVRDNINLQGLHTITNLRDPTAPGEAANKNYVDQITQHIQTEDDNVTISQT